MELSPSWEATTRSSTQQCSYLLWNPKFNDLVHKNPPPFPVLNHINPVNITPSSFFKINLILWRVRGSVMNNNGFWIGWLDLLTPSFKITAHNRWLPNTCSVPSWTTSVNSVVTLQFLQNYSLPRKRVLASRCLAMDCSGFQASCHNTIILSKLCIYSPSRPCMLYVHPILLDLIILIIFYELWSFLLRSFIIFLQIWRVTANISNNQSQTVDKKWSSSLEVGRGA
jgi:hypothetical protein